MSEQFERSEAAPAGGWQAVAGDLAHCVRFYSRLPVPALPWEQDAHALPNFPRLVRVIPLAGLLLGLVPAAALIVALLLDLGPWLSAMLAVATMVLATGALHEDGLADVADSFGGTTRDKRLEIMRDSRIGSFGASALFLALALRIGALAEIVSRADALAAVAAILITASLSRTAGLMPLVFLPPARRDGLSHAVGQPPRETFWLAAGIAGAIAVVAGRARRPAAFRHRPDARPLGPCGSRPHRLCGPSSRRADGRHRRRRAAGRGNRCADRPLDRSRTVTT